MNDQMLDNIFSPDGFYQIQQLYQQWRPFFSAEQQQNIEEILTVLESAGANRGELNAESGTEILLSLLAQLGMNEK